MIMIINTNLDMLDAGKVNHKNKRKLDQTFDQQGSSTKPTPEPLRTALFHESTLVFKTSLLPGTISFLNLKSLDIKRSFTF